MEVTHIPWGNEEDFTTEVPSNQVEKDELKLARQKGTPGIMEREERYGLTFSGAKITEARMCTLNTAHRNIYLAFVL